MSDEAKENSMPCNHPAERVTADILEGDVPRLCVQWCRLCGVWRRGIDKRLNQNQPERWEFGPWNEHEAVWADPDQAVAAFKTITTVLDGLTPEQQRRSLRAAGILLGLEP